MMRDQATSPGMGESDDFGDIDWDNAVELDSPYGPDAEIWGSPCIDFNPAELKLLLAACQLAEEDSSDFIRRAAMDQIATVLTEHPGITQSNAAAD